MTLFSNRCWFEMLDLDRTGGPLTNDSGGTAAGVYAYQLLRTGSPSGSEGPTGLPGDAYQ